MNIKKPYLECEYCSKRFVYVNAYEKHECEKMRRIKASKTRRGNAAFDDYKYWLTLKKKTIMKMETFLDSSFYTPIMKFQEYKAQKGIPDRKLFIKFMTDKRFDPKMWRNSDLYEDFILFYDQEQPAMEMVNISLGTLNKLASIFECDIGEVIENLLPAELARLIFERTLSPWLLLLSDKFKHYLHILTDPAQYIMITNVIDANDWRSKFSKKPKTVEKIKSIIKEFGL